LRSSTGADSFLSGVIKLCRKRRQQIPNAGYRQSCRLLADDRCLVGKRHNSFFLVSFSEQPLLAIERAVTVLVISCPHALGLLQAACRRRVHIDCRSQRFVDCDRTAFEEARRTQAIVFDKTGTLTKGNSGSRRSGADKAMKEANWWPMLPQ
jgi:Cu2+-exporting ATPase